MRLNEQVKRNQNRFPADFCFRLTRSEQAEVSANGGHHDVIRKLDALEKRHDHHFKTVFDALRVLLKEHAKTPIGFR